MAKNKRRSKRKAAPRRRKRRDEVLSAAPDRRTMEGMMRQLLPEVGDGGETSVEAAQQLMDEAFETDNPKSGPPSPAGSW